MLSGGQYCWRPAQLLASWVFTEFCPAFWSVALILEDNKVSFIAFPTVSLYCSVNVSSVLNHKSSIMYIFVFQRI